MENTGKEKASISVKEFHVPALDGFLLRASIFESKISNPSRKIIIINPGLGLRASIYRPIARYFASNGYAVLSYDYRGMGRSRPGSLRKFDTSFQDWGRNDFGGILKYVVGTYPSSKIQIIGHSTGGAILGFSPLCNRIENVIMVGAQLGNWRLWPGYRKWMIASLVYVFVPALAYGFGYLPARMMGWGDDCPKSLALSWARWMKHKYYFFGYPDEVSPLYFDKMRASILWHSFSDDNTFAPKRAVDAFVPFFPNCQVERIHISPSEINRERLGHSGFFSKKSRSTLWRTALNWLNSKNC